MASELPAELFFAEKPNGISSHRPSPNHVGFVEGCEQFTNQKLFVCHRLDKETSGAMVFAKSKEAASELTELFSTQQIQKTYLFVSHKKSQFENWVVIEDKAQGTLLQECPLQKEGVGYQSFTEFVRISSVGQFYLYKAFPKTGKTHQIRKHALHSQIPILGDEQYQGQKFTRLMLHCLELQFSWKGSEVKHSSNPSRLFEDLNLCEDPQLSCWINAFERREKLFPKLMESEESLRIFHSETSDLRGEKAGPITILGWWKSEQPSDLEKEKIKTLMDLLGIKNWIFQWRPGAQDPSSTEVLLKGSEFKAEDWEFLETGLRYRGSLERGQNFGLFLDQRDRRSWVRQNSKGKDVLNLFAFTCGFSLNAASGDAQSVVSVDLFAKYLEWGKENFDLNGLNPEDSKFQWRKMDSLEFLRYAKKKGLQFDTIICDPPSFSRAKKSKKVFRVERDFKELVELCVDLLKPQGTLLFSCNYEKWSFDRWDKELRSLAPSLGDLEVSASRSQWDYEWQKMDANLKAFFIKKA